MPYEPLIDRTYFTAELNIGQVDQPSVEEELKEYIRKYEHEFLTKVMGKELYLAFYQGMQGQIVADRWKTMAYGSSFILDASKVKTGVTVTGTGQLRTIPYFRYYDKMNVDYRGFLKRANSNTATDFVNDGYGASSPISRYVYYWYMRYRITLTGGAGESNQQVHNGQAVNNNQKMVWAWNQMCEEVFHFYLFVDMNRALYPEYVQEPDNRFCPVPINEFNI